MPKTRLTLIHALMVEGLAGEQTYFENIVFSLSYLGASIPFWPEPDKAQAALSRLGAKWLNKPDDARIDLTRADIEDAVLLLNDARWDDVVVTDGKVADIVSEQFMGEMRGAGLALAANTLNVARVKAFLPQPEVLSKPDAVLPKLDYAIVHRAYSQAINVKSKSMVIIDEGLFEIEPIFVAAVTALINRRLREFSVASVLPLPTDSIELSLTKLRFAVVAALARREIVESQMS